MTRNAAEQLIPDQHLHRFVRSESGFLAGSVQLVFRMREARHFFQIFYVKRDLYLLLQSDDNSSDDDNQDQC